MLRFALLLLAVCAVHSAYGQARIWSWTANGEHRACGDQVFILSDVDSDYEFRKSFGEHLLSTATLKVVPSAPSCDGQVSRVEKSNLDGVLEAVRSGKDGVSVVYHPSDLVYKSQSRSVKRALMATADDDSTTVYMTSSILSGMLVFGLILSGVFLMVGLLLQHRSPDQFEGDDSASTSMKKFQ